MGTTIRESRGRESRGRFSLTPFPSLLQAISAFKFRSPLDNPPPQRYNKNEERTTHAVAPQFKLFPFVTLSNHENSRHLPEWRLFFILLT